MAGRLDQLGPVRNEALVMTTLTATGDTRVNRCEECCRREHISGIVTQAAIIACGNMIHRLRRCDTRVMAGRTVVAVDTKVVEGNTGKACKVVGHMARRTIKACRYMIQ